MVGVVAPHVAYEGVGFRPIIDCDTDIWGYVLHLAGPASQPKHHTIMNTVTIRQDATQGTASSLSSEWVTAIKFEDIVGFLADAHDGSGPSPATKVDTNRLYLSPSSRESTNVFVAHKRSSTVFWNAQQGKSGAVYFFGHFYDASAQGDVSEPILARALDSSTEITRSGLSAQQRRRLFGPPLRPTSEELPDLSLIARHALTPEQMGEVLFPTSPAARFEDSSDSSSAEEVRSGDDAADDWGRWRAVLFTQEGPLRPATEASISCHRPLIPLKPLTLVQLAAGFRELLDANALSAPGAKTSDMYGEEFTLNAHQVAQAAQFHDALQTMDWPSEVTSGQSAGTSSRSD